MATNRVRQQAANAGEVIPTFERNRLMEIETAYHNITEILRKLKLFSRNKAIIELRKLPLPLQDVASKAEKPH